MEKKTKMDNNIRIRGQPNWRNYNKIRIRKKLHKNKNYKNI